MDPRLDFALARSGQALQRVDAMLAWLGTSGLEEFAVEQRVQMMRAVAARRMEIEAALDRQREEVQSVVQKERNEITARVTRERVAAMANAQRVADRAISDAAGHAIEMVDYVIIRIAILLGAGLVAGLAIIWVVRRRRSSLPPST